MRHPSSIVMRLAVISGLTSAAGCASGGSHPPEQPQTTDRIVATDDRGHVVRTTDVNSGTDVRIHASAANAMAALSQIYPDLGIPIGTAISAAGQIGNQNYRVPGHRLKTLQLSRIIECGQESVTGSRADVDEVTISVMSTIKSDGDSASVVTTFVSASARPLGTSGNAVTCATNGTLEEIIGTRLQKALAPR
jgi:hypothetical protein